MHAEVRLPISYANTRNTKRSFASRATAEVWTGPREEKYSYHNWRKGAKYELGWNVITSALHLMVVSEMQR